jgi:Tol biopolymer transport system component
LRTTIAKLATALALLAATASAVPAGVAADEFHLESTIAFSSNRDNLALGPLLGAELYLIDPDGTNRRRMTNNTDGDAFAALSPDGKKIVFDSNRNRAPGEPLNTSDLFVMGADGSEQTLLTRGSSATWSPDGKDIAYHRSASGAGLPIKPDPGAPASDSDIFVANVDDLPAAPPLNATNTPSEIEEDADWSTAPTTAPAGQRIVFTSHPATDDPQLSNQAEIRVMNPDGTGRVQLTHNGEEERAASWSPDGNRIVYSCRIGGGGADFEICVMNARGGGLQQLTDNTVADLTATFSPDGEQVVFQRQVPGQGFQLFTMQSKLNEDDSRPTATQLTFPPGINLFANWGGLRVHGSAGL